MGSAARGTWLAGDHDLDIFLSIPEDGDLGEAMEIARAIAPLHEERYAEHPYVHAVIDGFDVDLVPCYDIRDPSRIRSAVDRTPFHSRYVSRRIGGLEDDVLLLKQFMKGVGVYGSELRTGGFSGYLAELLVLRYRSFEGVLMGASYWRPNEKIDIEGHGSAVHGDPLVVVDPVDPKRNVAAALTLDRMAEFTTSSRCYLADPEMEFFLPPMPASLTREVLAERMRDRGTRFILVEFRAPDMVDDVIFPQLRKAEASVRALLEREGFAVLRNDVDVSTRKDGKLARMLFEQLIWELAPIKKHIGPPVWDPVHLQRFVSGNALPITGPYIEEARAVVEVRRRHTKAVDLLRLELPGLSLGKHIGASIRSEFRLYSGEEILEIDDPSLREFLSRYLNRSVRICRRVCCRCQ